MAVTIITILCTLTVFAYAVQGDAIAKREGISSLAKRQGAYDATCCDAGTYARPGYYCCSGGGSCPVGETCLACTPEEGNAPTSAVAPSRSSFVPVTTPPPDVTSTITRTSYTYFTITITYYYYQFYWIYVPTLTRSTSTSSEVTTTYVTSVYASNSADAQTSIEEIASTASFPTPELATELPPLETSSADDGTSTSSRRPSTTASLESVSSAASASASSSVVEFTGGAGGQGRVGATLYSSLGAW
ncbi:hypothetical protein PMIN01_10506 [Paraphaeosphaeria minitans]|uniref:Uncharacterized protein n=1 Tax=Paraphaeosphaeria minitans TaxID=565426 RepID=A0A9P6G9V7_9PLEO|nr:hypothetical protein PMIN01_10506 [Paraphaeosphaeria minitans]